MGSTAGDTDLLITWLYKLTIDNQYYDVGAVIGIITFITLIKNFFHIFMKCKKCA